MRVLPPAARAFVLGAVLAAAACVAPALVDPATPWADVALLAALHLGCERVRFGPRPAGAAAAGSGTFLPVLFAAVFLLPPGAAALVAVPGGLAQSVSRRPARVRRVWHAARQALAAWAAGWAAGGAHALPDGPGFPYALLPALVAAVVLCLVLGALDLGVLAAAEGRRAVRARRPPVPGSPLPYCVHGLVGLMAAVMWRSPYGLPAALLVLVPVYVSCRVFDRCRRERAAHRATIRALVRAVDIKDRYTRGHSERVGQASEMIARELGMADDRMEVVRIAGILHDVGKLGVPTRLLRKDGPLTPEERRVIELHPEYGHEIVRGIGFLGEARSAILHHHERVDGSGYPYGLTGEQIPVLARVVAVADSFDAMTSTRSYSRARPVATALAELERCAGAQFDPAMVRALVDAVGRHGWHPVVTSDADLQVIAAAGGEGGEGGETVPEPEGEARPPSAPPPPSSASSPPSAAPGGFLGRQPEPGRRGTRTGRDAR
ncbi:HD-GYP domain-containing protein [Streptomyces sp. NPDC048606]|uniref:HD-GYP domain-containing protein n=1 Tax=Streptomyces sp. NPDC048606 TaxID=3154726 RepID=UPI00341DC16A